MGRMACTEPQCTLPLHKGEGQFWWPLRSRKKKVPQNISLRSCLKALVFREMFHSQISLEANEQALLPCETTAPHTNRLHGGVISFENGMANTPLEFYATYRPTAIFTHIQAASPCLNEIKPTDILRH